MKDPGKRQKMKGSDFESKFFYFILLTGVGRGQIEVSLKSDLVKKVKVLYN